MTKRSWIGGAIAVAAVATLAGGLMASNMGFKLNYTLVAAGNPVAGFGETGNSNNGTSTIALPFFRQSGLDTASSLRTDIGAAAGPVSKFLRASNTLQSYTGTRGSVDFNLEEGVGYLVKLNGTTNVNYIIVGSDDPGYALTLIAAGQPVPEGGTSANGTNWYAYKYHSTAATASALRADIGPNAGPVSKFLRNTNTFISYTGTRGSQDFPLVPGEMYAVKINGTANVPYTASHY